MQRAANTRYERYLRFSHYGIVLVLTLSIVTGAAFLTVTLRPGGVLAQGLPRIVPALPVALAIVLGALAMTLRGERWNPAAPEAQRILRDEWRQANLNGAARTAVVTVLALQAPLGFLLRDLPAPRGVMAMAATTLTFGMAAFLATFLFLAGRGDAGS